MMLCRLAHLPSIATRVGWPGVQVVLKAKCLLTRFMVRLQQAGLSAMFVTMLIWRRSCAPGEPRFTAVGVAHLWDGTTQRLPEGRPSGQARQPKQKVGKTVLVQKTMVHSMATQRNADGSWSTFVRGENWLVPTLEIPGKATQVLRDAMLSSGACSQYGPLRVEDPACMRAIAESVDAMVWTLWPDGASQNLRWARHLCGIAERDQWPPSLLLDPQELCLLHQVHRVKTYTMESMALVGLRFCFA